MWLIARDKLAHPVNRIQNILAGTNGLSKARDKIGPFYELLCYGNMLTLLCCTGAGFVSLITLGRYISLQGTIDTPESEGH